MLSQDKCLPIAYKCLGFTVLFVLEKYCGFTAVFIWHREPISTIRSCPAASPGEARGHHTHPWTHTGPGWRAESGGRALGCPSADIGGESDVLQFRGPTVLPQAVALSRGDLCPPPPWPQTACCRADKAEAVAQPGPRAVAAPDDRREAR